MSSFETILPFPRGKTACDGVTTPTSNMYEYAGRLFLVRDTIHGTGKMVVLRCVQLTNNLTAARKFVKFSTATAKDFGRKVSGYNDVQGGPAKPLDDAYNVGQALLANDYVYVVEDGPCYVTTESGAVNLAAGAAVVSDNAGCVDGAPPAAGDCVVGRIDSACTTSGAVVVIHVNQGLVGGEGAPPGA